MSTRYLLELSGIGVFEIANPNLNVSSAAIIPQFSYLSLVLANDTGLARLLAALTAREAISGARVVGLTSNGHGGETITYEVRLQNVFVASVNDTGSSQINSGYDISLSYGAIGLSTYDVAPDGTARYTGGFGYTVATNITTTDTPSTPAPVAEPATAAVPVKYYLLIAGLNGGSTDPGHVGWFELASFQDGISVSGTRPSLTSVSIAMAADTGLGPVFYNLTAGRVLTGARIEGVDANGQSVYDMVLAGVRVSSAQDERVGYRFALDYQRVQLTTDGGTSGGTPLPDSVFTWNTTTNTSAIGTLPTLAVGTARAPDPAVTGYTLKIAGIGEFGVADFSIGATNSSSFASGGGTGRVSYQDLTVTLTNDAGLTLLMAALTAQTHYTRVDLLGLTPSPVNGAPVISQDTILTDAWVTSISDASGGGYRVTLSFNRISMNTFAYNASGTASSTGGYEYDIPSNIIRSSSGDTRPSAVLSGTAAPVVSDKFYLLIDGLNGGSTDPGHVGWFELPAFSAGASFSTTSSITAFQSISAVLYGTSPIGQLSSYVTSGVHLRGARIEGTRADGQVNYRLTLGDVVVSSVQDSAYTFGGAFGGSSQVSLDFSRYSLTTNPDAAGGGLGPDQTASWDLVSRSSAVTLPTIAVGTGSGAANLVSSMVLKLANIGEFSVLSYSFGAQNNSPNPPSGTPTVSFSDLQVVVANDAGLAVLLDSVAKGTHIANGWLVGLTPSPLTGTPVVSYNLNLQNVVVSSITSTSSGGYFVTLDYARVALSTYAYAPDGARSLIDGFSYDLATRTGTANGSATPNVTLAGTADPVAPVKYFLLIDGLTGGSLDADHVGWFDLPDFGFGVTQSATALGAAGQNSFSTLSVGLNGDAGLGELLRLASADTALRGIRIEGVRADGQRVYQLSLGTVKVDAVTDTGAGYSAAFSYNTIDLITNATLANNGLGGNVERDWDVLQNRSGVPAITIAPLVPAASEASDVLVGGPGDDVLRALGGSDRLYGNAGNDTLDGGTGAANLLQGGTGNDTYIVGAAGDTIIELAGQGTDEVRTALGVFTLAANVENLTFTGGATSFVGIGNASGNVILGGTGRDQIAGLDGDDTLGDGGGVVGNEDTLIGGRGNDTYLVALRGDSIVEYADEGIDEVRTALRFYSLAANVENLTFTDGTPHNAFGNAGDNILTGNTGRDELQGLDGNDTLSDGGGVVGNEDTLIGGTGNDTYLVTLRGDSVIEYAGEGTDEVRTSLGVYVLSDHVEILTFTDDTGHAGVGSAQDNMITGGTGGDELNGLGGNDTIVGGSGAANTLLGGTGDDLFIVTASGDSVIEYAGEGTDTVQTTLSVFYLRDNVENLVFTGTGSFSGIGSSDNNTLTAGAGADFLSGNDGNDILIGGSGADLLIGGNGADQFMYLGGETGYDRIIDFVAGTDKIALASAGFAHTATLAFVSGAGAVANSANSTFLYDTNTGIVSYDADGNGAGEAVQLAQLNTGLPITVDDFIFF